MNTITLTRTFKRGNLAIMLFEKKFFNKMLMPIKFITKEANTLFELQPDKYGLLIEYPVAVEYSIHHLFISSN